MAYGTGNKAEDRGREALALNLALTGGSDPNTNTILMGTQAADLAGKDNGAGMPWGPMKSGDPGSLNLPKDASQMPGYGGSAGAQALASSLAAQRARASISDPYAASQENARKMVEANMGHENWQSQQQMLKIRQNMALQQYLQDLEAFEREQNQRAAEYDRFGRTAYGGGQAILSYFTKGAFSGNKPDKDKNRVTIDNSNAYGGVGYKPYGPYQE